MAATTPAKPALKKKTQVSLDIYCVDSLIFWLEIVAILLVSFVLAKLSHYHTQESEREGQSLPAGENPIRFNQDKIVAYLLSILQMGILVH